MSIAVTAPEKFDFQDLVCIAIALRFWEREGVSLIVEPTGGEDALLQLPKPAAPQAVEVQVKGSEANVDLGSIVDCLLHFPERADTGSLLERLLNDSDRQILLVMSGRCDDSAIKFVAPSDWNGAPHKPGHFLLRDAEAVIAVLAAKAIVKGEVTKLEKRRLSRVKTLHAAIDPTALRGALERIVVLERVNAANLDDEIGRRLRNDFHVPTDAIPDVIARLRQAIKHSKTNQVEAYNGLRSALASAAGFRLVVADYVLRGDEDSLEATLVRDRAMLLSGRPRTGKSLTARYLASRMQSQGYKILEATDIDVAERFLLDPDGRDRLVLLDDPLGGITPAHDAPRILDRAIKLIDKLPLNRKLIVAQSQEQLLATTRCFSLEEAGAAGHVWHDLSTSSFNFLADLWLSLCKQTGFPSDLAEQIGESLRNGTLVLEPGCLSHLAANGRRATIEGGVSSAVRIAREDAVSLARALVVLPDIEGLIGAMAIGSRPGIPIAHRELAFMLGAGGDELPSLPPKHVFLGMVLGGEEPEPAPPPEYSTEPTLSPAFEHGLEQLERLRCVTVTGNGHVGFAHPFYLAAGELSLDASTFQAGARLQRFVRRALFCNASLTSRAAARNLDWLFDNSAKNKEVRDGLLKIAQEGLKSDFPATRDFCLDFLIRRIASLPADDRNDLPDWTRSATHVDLNTIQWVTGEARFPSRDIGSGGRYVLRMLETVPKDEAEPYIAALERADDPVSPEVANRALLYFSRHSDELSASAMQRLLSYDEAFIRAQAVRIWFEENRTDDAPILERIFVDSHPSIADASLLGTIFGWDGWDGKRREDLLPRIAQSGSASAAAALMLTRLEVFDRQEYSGENPPWEVFGRLLPTVMRALPIGAFVNDARLYGAVRASVSELPAADLVSICDAWIDWIGALVADGRLPADYTLGVVDFLIPATAKRPDLREGRVARLLNHQATGVLLVFLKDLIDEWPTLTSSEQQLILEKLGEERRDQHWLLAVTLLRHTVPEEVQALVLGPTLRLTADAHVMFARLRPVLLEAVLSIECGHPGILWQLGIHHSGTALWPGVLRECLKDSRHPQFEIALQEAIFHEDDDLVADSIRTAHSETLEELFAILIKQRALYTGNWLPKAWAELLRRAPNADVRDRWNRELGRDIHVLIEGLSDVLRWLTEDTDHNAILQFITADFAIRKLTLDIDRLLVGPANANEAELIKNGVATIMAENPPRLHETCSELKRTLDRHGIIDNDLATTIENHRLAILEDIKIIRKRYRDTDFDEEPQDWIDPTPPNR